MIVVVASASLARPVSPTAVPTSAFSVDRVGRRVRVVTAPTSNSSTSLTLIVKACVLNEPSAEVARTVMLCEAAASRSSSVPSATVTTPVDPLIANRPPALSSSEYVIALVVASASLAAAVIPTTVPLAAFSSTALAAAFVSLRRRTSNSSTSPMVIVNGGWWWSCRCWSRAP